MGAQAATVNYSLSNLSVTVTDAANSGGTSGVTFAGTDFGSSFADWLQPLSYSRVWNDSQNTESTTVPRSWTSTGSLRAGTSIRYPGTVSWDISATDAWGTDEAHGYFSSGWYVGGGNYGSFELPGQTGGSVYGTTYWGTPTVHSDQASASFDILLAADQGADGEFRLDFGFASSVDHFGAPSPVPEPSSYALMVAGLVAVGAARCSRRRV